MTRRRWIADEYSADRAALTGAHAAHLSRTLRARVGQEFEVACGDRVRRATVASVSEDRVEFALGEEVTASAIVPSTLLLAIFKFDRMEWAIEKCTELNVTTIVPVVARRTEKHLALAAAKRVERWRRIAREAAEQSRRASPPEIREPLKLADAIAQLHDSSIPTVIPSEDLDALHAVIPTEDFSPPHAVIPTEDFSPPHAVIPTEDLDALHVVIPTEDLDALHAVSPTEDFSPPHAVIPTEDLDALHVVIPTEDFSPPHAVIPTEDFSPSGGICGSPGRNLRIVLAETEREATLIEVLRARDDVKSLSLAVGPEGGWTADELQIFEQSQWIAASLGETILRAETAAIAALAIARTEV